MFLQVVGSEKPSFHVAFELLFLHGGLQLFVRPDATCDFLQVLSSPVTTVTYLLIITQCLVKHNSLLLMVANMSRLTAVSFAQLKPLHLDCTEHSIHLS